MKYCLSSRQTNEYLEKADEIRIKYKDRDIIYDFSQKYPNAYLILELPPIVDAAVDWQEIEKYKVVSQDKLIVCVAKISDAKECRTRGIPFYYGFPVGTFYELQALKALGVCYIKLAPPAFFQMPEVKRLGIPVRVVPNIAHDGYLPRENGINGQWIRPEDIDMYEEYVDTVEFDGVELSKERALYRIYHDEKNWPGDINMIITNFNYPAVNRLIPERVLAERRLVCGQRCQSGGACRLCNRYVAMAQEDIMRKLAEKVNASKD